MSETSDAGTKAIQAILSPVLQEAEAMGLNFRPINGLVEKRARKLGIDLDELGAGADGHLDDQTYYDHLIVACWLIGAAEDVVRRAMAEGLAHDEAEVWWAAAAPTVRHEHAAMRALIGRWAEYRIEMERLFNPAALDDEATVG